MVSDAATVRRSPRVEFRSLGDEDGGVLLHVGSGAYHGVNEIGALVWGLLDEEDGSTLDGLIAELKTRLEDAPATLREEIGGFIDELAARDLVIVSDAST